jgi:serine/threonine protein kinase
LTGFTALAFGPTDPPCVAGYEVLECLGQGGMGCVYKARHTRLGRLVALKIIRPDRLADPEVLRRFQREARAAARLSHPNLVEVFDAGQVLTPLMLSPGCGGPASPAIGCDPPGVGL